jgi:hypothetical protein
MKADLPSDGDLAQEVLDWCIESAFEFVPANCSSLGSIVSPWPSPASHLTFIFQMLSLPMVPMPAPAACSKRLKPTAGAAW